MHSTSESRDLYLLNPKVCGIPVMKFMSSSPLVSSFPNEFGTVELSNLKNGGLLDRRPVHKESVFVAFFFGVASAILRQKLKAGEEEKYGWLVDTINHVKIGQECPTATVPRDDNNHESCDPEQNSVWCRFKRPTISDQGWQTFTKLGRTKVSHMMFFKSFCIAVLCMWWNLGSGRFPPRI